MRRSNQATTTSDRYIETITIDSDSDMDDSSTNSVALNMDVGYQILDHLTSIDATNFLEVVNESRSEERRVGKEC